MVTRAVQQINKWTFLIVDQPEGFGIDILQLGQYSRLLYHMKE